MCVCVCVEWQLSLLPLEHIVRDWIGLLEGTHTHTHTCNIATYRYREVILHITGIQIALKSNYGVGSVLVAEQQRVVLRGIVDWFTVTVRANVTILGEKNGEKRNKKKPHHEHGDKFIGIESL